MNIVAKSSGLCLDVTGGPSATGAGVKLQQWSCNGGTNQQFQFQAVAGGYQITARNSSLSLDLPSASKANGTVVEQEPFQGGPDALWNVSTGSDSGTYQITSALDGSCLSINNKSTANGAAVTEWDCVQVPAQEWSFAPVQTSTSKAVVLPVEVMGADGITKSVQVTVPASANVASPLNLYLQIHGLEYANEASVQVNGGAWVTLNNQSVSIQGLAKIYGGIGGGYNTIPMTIGLPAGLVKTGSNTIQFRFNATDGNSSGFRVLAFNFQLSDGTSLLPASSFTNDNPSSWSASTSPSDIAAGASLYKTAALSQPNGSSRTGLRAHCGDCHTADGRDLKYFNYSNNAIYTRAVWHGLNSTQANQIVSYIRSLQTPAPSMARPWNPPYQPGPGVDDRPVSEWAAGAGLSAVLATDAGMESYLAPGGSTAGWSATSNINLRELPVAIQMPDWNHWLPEIHPLDAWGSAFSNDQYSAYYNTIRSGLTPGDASSYSSMAGNFSFWDLAQSSFLGPRTPNWSDPAWNSSLRKKIYSSALWHMVKLWEINQEFGLESMPGAVYGANTETPSWFGQFAFNTSPNMIHVPAGSGLGNGSQEAQTYSAYMWYEVQLVQNAGYKHQVGTVPIDWSYVHGYMKGLNWDTSPNGNGPNGAPEAMLQLSILIKALQISSGTPAAGTSGWHVMNSDPSRLIDGAWGNIWSATAPATRASLSQAYLQAWFDKISTFAPSTFYQGGWTTSSYVPTSNEEGQLGDKVWAMIPRFKFVGVSSDLTNKVAAWAATIWPNANWNQDANASCSSPNLGTISCSTDR